MGRRRFSELGPYIVATAQAAAVAMFVLAQLGSMQATHIPTHSEPPSLIRHGGGTAAAAPSTPEAPRPTPATPSGVPPPPPTHNSPALAELRCPQGPGAAHWADVSRWRGDAIRKGLSTSPKDTYGPCPLSAERPICFMKDVGMGARDGMDAPFVTPQWVGGHRVHWYTSEEACAVVDKIGLLVLVGDSLTRHLTQALLTVMAGNYYNATEALVPAVGHPDTPRCVCEWAYNDGHYGFAEGSQAGDVKNRFCREHSIATPESARKLRARIPDFCPHWGEHTDILFLEHFMGTSDETRKIVASRLGGGGQGKGVMYNAGGLHTGMTERSVKAHFTEIYEKLAPTGIQQICALVHAPGQNHPIQYQRTQGREMRLKYNEMIRSGACRADPSRQFHFDAWTPTLNCTSFDGTHFGQAPNIILAQLLLNLLDVI